MEIIKNEKHYTPAEVKDIVGVSARRLYYWELRGAVQPKLISLGSREFRRYSESDIRKLKKIKQYLEEGFVLDKAFEKADKE